MKKWTLSTKSKKSWKAPLFLYRRGGCPEIEEIDANDEISVLVLECRGSEIEKFDAFDEIEEIMESARTGGYGVKKSEKSTQKKKYLCSYWRVGGQ